MLKDIVFVHDGQSHSVLEWTKILGRDPDYVGQYRGIDREQKSASNPYCHVVAFPSLNEKLNLGLREILAKDEELKRRR